jgi:methylmalonyl-CoA/ethylmalonyl-CoA epimerase
MIKKLDHIGIAVFSLTQARPAYEALLGAESPHQEIVDEQKVATAFYPISGVNIELLSPTDPSSTIARFIEKRGEGIHHLCFEVEDLQAERNRLRAAGIEFLSEPSPGANNSLVAFIHPRKANGVLIELVEYVTESDPQ